MIDDRGRASVSSVRHVVNRGFGESLPDYEDVKVTKLYYCFICLDSVDNKYVFCYLLLGRLF